MYLVMKLNKVLDVLWHEKDPNGVLARLVSLLLILLTCQNIHEFDQKKKTWENAVLERFVVKYFVFFLICKNKQLCVRIW